MSFSSDIKQQILENVEKQSKQNNVLDLIKFGELITEVSSYNEFSEEFKNYKSYLNIATLNLTEISYVLCGIFLGSGSISNPKKEYHFEIVLKCKYFLDYTLDLMSLIEFTPRYIKRKTKRTTVYVIYLKEAEQISLFLSMINASSSMLYFEQIRVEKEVKNNINRSINCETANLSKTIESSLKQVQAIEKLQKLNVFFKLEEDTKYIASLRLTNREDSLAELSVISKNKNKPFTKSSIKRHLDKIIKLSDEI